MLRDRIKKRNPILYALARQQLYFIVGWIIGSALGHALSTNHLTIAQQVGNFLIFDATVTLITLMVAFFFFWRWR